MMRRPTVLFHVDEWRRDVLGAVYLQRLLAELGCEMLPVTRRTLPAYYRKVAFDAAILPSPVFLPQNSGLDVRGNPRFYLLPTEGALPDEFLNILKYTGSRNDEELRRRYVAAFHRMFVWGDKSMRILSASGRFREGQLVLSGAPRIQFVTPYDSMRAKMPVGMVSRLAVFNPYINYSRLQALDEARNAHGYLYDADRNYEDFLWMEAAAARLTLEFLDLCREHGIRVRYRPHPREMLSGYSYVLDKYGDVIDFSDLDMPFEMWLETVSMVVSFNSTTFYETLLGRIPALTLTPLIGPRLQEHVRLPAYHYEIRDYIYQPRSFTDVIDSIRAVQAGTIDEQRFFPRYAEARAIVEGLYHVDAPEPALEYVARSVAGDLCGNAAGEQPLARLRRQWIDWRYYRRRPRKPSSQDTIYDAAAAEKLCGNYARKIYRRWHSEVEQ